MTGSIDAPIEAQLSNFGYALREYGDSKQPLPSNWTEAFEALKMLLKPRLEGKLFDEENSYKIKEGNLY